MIDAGSVMAYLDLDSSKYKAGIASAIAAAKDLGNKSLSASGKLKGMGSAMTQLGQSATGLTVALAGVGTAAVTSFAKFDDAIRQVWATMDATADEQQRLVDIAKDAASGPDATKNIYDVAAGLDALAAAGYDVEQSQTALSTVMLVAQAGNLDMARSTDILAGSMNALDLEMEKLPEFADQISSAAQNSNASIAEMGDALLSVGGYAKQLAGGTTELTTGLGVLADAMIKGSEGGTSLRNIIRALASPEDGAAKVLKELGVSAYDATTGAFRPLNETLGDLDAALSKLNPEKRAQQMSKIFNAFDLNAAEVLMASTSGRWTELSAAITASEGSMQTMADTLEGGLGGAVRGFLANLSVAGVEVGEVFEPNVRAATERLSEFVQWFRALPPEMRSTIVNVGALVAALGPALIIGGKLVSAFGALAPLFSGPGGWVTLGLAGVAALAGALALLPGQVDAVDAALSRVDTDKVDAFRKGLSDGEAKLSIDVEAKVPDAGSIYDKVFAALTDGKPDTEKQKKELQAEIQGYYDDLIEQVNLDTETKLANLKTQLENGFITMEEYQTRADVIRSENGVLIADVQKTCADSLAYVSEMSGKSTEAVKGSLDRLEDLKARAAAAKAEVEKLLEETASEETKRAQRLVKAGVRTDEATTGLAFSGATSQFKLDTYDAEQRAAGRRAAADQRYDEAAQKPGADLERLKAEHDAQVAQIEADLAADKARISAALLQSLNELFAGLASQDAELQAQLSGAFEKLDIAQALQDALDSGDAGWVPLDDALMERVGKALGIDDPAAFLESFLTAKDTAGFYSAVESYIGRLTDSAATEMQGLDTSALGTTLKGLIQEGILDGLEFDDASARDKLALALGKLNLPQVIADAMAQPTGSGSSDGKVDVPVTVVPNPTVEDGAAQKIYDAVGDSVASGGAAEGDGMGAAAPSVEVPVTVSPAPVVEDGGGQKLVEAVAGSILDGVDSVTTAGNAISKAAAAAFRSEIGAAKEAGSAMVQGLINGAEAKRGSLVAKFTSLAKAAIIAARSELQINSPSKVFAAIGAGTVEGLVQGVDKNIHSAQDAMRRLTSLSALSPSAITGAGASYSSSSVVNNNHYGAPVTVTFPGAVVRSDDDLRELERRTQKIAKDLQYGLGAR